MNLAPLFTTLAALLMATPVTAQVPFALETLAQGLSQPVFATAPASDPRLFIVEQTGTIRILADGIVSDEPFLDVTPLIRARGEQGLLGLAFHPDYASNGRFFVNYTDRRGDTQVVGYTVSADPDAADPGSAAPLFSVDQPRANHNGGWLGFGPDGQLYIGMGDGGGAGDTPRNGQNPNTLLGKILRIDVDAGTGPEIFASGVRNPWRNAFDGDDLYIADVGQGAWEEVNVVAVGSPGINLGWSIMEGDACFRPRQGCDQNGLTLPVASYSHDIGCSITGGYVYRGSAIPALTGLYFLADYCSGVVSSLRYNGDSDVIDIVSYADTLGSIGNVTSFGTDSAGELYVMTQDGVLRKFVPAS